MYDYNWRLHFVPECYFDTVLFTKLLQAKKGLLHKRGCNYVIKALQEKDLKDSFAVAIIDKDKKEIDYLLECDIVRAEAKFLVWKHRIKPHFIIQIYPPIENWIVGIMAENGLKIENFGYPENFKKLKKAIKDQIDSESDERLNKLVNAIINTNCETINRLRSILQFLKEKIQTKNYDVDINELKNV